MDIPAPQDARIAALFEAYAAALGRSDARAVAALFAYPLTIRQGRAVRAYSDATALTAEIEALIDVLDEADIFASSAEVVATSVAGACAGATVRWRQADPRGIVLHTFTAFYLLTRDGADWRIAAVASEGAA